METDSAYIALAGQNLEDLVKPELKKKFFEEWNNWLPTECNPVQPTRKSLWIPKWQGMNGKPNLSV